MAADPTATELKARFPKFAAVEDATVTAFIVEAGRMVDSSWLDGDFAMGKMLWACHLMTLEGLGTGAESELAAAGIGDFKSIKSGSLSLDRFDKGQSIKAGSTESTSYGVRWLELAKRNKRGPRLMPTGELPTDQLYGNDV